MMRRSKAEELGQPILAKFVDTALAGLPPRIMGIGPVYAIPKLLARHGLDLHKDVDVIEINEAFSSMAVSAYHINIMCFVTDETRSTAATP